MLMLSHYHTVIGSKFTFSNIQRKQTVDEVEIMSPAEKKDFQVIVEEAAPESSGRTMVKPDSLCFVHYECSLSILILFVTVHYQHGNTQIHGGNMSEPTTKGQLGFALTDTMADRQPVEGDGTGN